MCKFVRLVPLLAILGCGDNSPPRPVPEKPFVATVNYHLAFYAEHVTEGWPEVYFPLPKGTDPIDWKPDAESMERFRKTSLLLTNGPGYAKWTQELGLPAEKYIDTTLVFKNELANDPTALEQLRGCYWLDLALCVKQWHAIEAAMIKSGYASDAQRTHEAVYLPLKLTSKNLTFHLVTRRLRDVPLVASRPIYHYFAKAYGLDIQSVDWKPDRAPTEEQIKNLKEILKTHPAKYMIWDSKPAPAAEEPVRALGLESYVIDPCATRPLSGDFMTVVDQNLQTLQSISEMEGGQ